MKEMKLILAIVHNDDAPIVAAQLTKEGIHITKIASTGGFLMTGNTTFITGVEDSRVNDVIELISKYSRKRSQAAPPDAAQIGNASGLHNIPAEILVGGGTIFVLNIEKYEHV